MARQNKHYAEDIALAMELNTAGVRWKLISRVFGMYMHHTSHCPDCIHRARTLGMKSYPMRTPK